MLALLLFPLVGIVVVGWTLLSACLVNAVCDRLGMK